MDAHRAERLAAALRDELYELINFRLEDPRIHQVEVPAIELSPDGKRAVVRIVVNGGGTRLTETLAALDHARSFLKRELAESLDLYRVPELYFESAAQAGPPDKIEFLLRRIKRGRPRDDGESQK